MSKLTMQDFFTRNGANEGVQIPLHTPTGEKSEHWLRVRGTDSDAFRAADAKGQRKLAELMATVKTAPETDVDAGMAGIKREVIASLVCGWSFDGECTQEAVCELFINAPQIMDMVDKFAGRRSLFFALKLKGSTPTPATNSGSTASRKAPRKRTAKT